ncbi:MAG: hypothetical protein KF914_13240 [Rhizobiaceae bacterium]|nr:hypothetical protein [Rhizobiaceae bacterium]
MGDKDMRADDAGMAIRDAITEADVLEMRRTVYPDGVVTRSEAERLFALDAASGAVCEGWNRFFVEAVTDYVVHQERPAGHISEDNADWLIRMATRDGVVQTSTELELLVTVLEKAASSPERLGAFVLAQVAAAAVEASGPLARADKPAGMIDGEEVALIRRILHAGGGDGNIGITRAEAEVLMTINEGTDPLLNDPSWNELFVKAICSHVLGPSGHTTSSREDALRREAFLDAAPSVGGFLSRMVSGGLGAVVDAYATERGTEAAWSRRNAERAAQTAAAEAVDSGEAEWLAGRLGTGRSLQENERTLLLAIKASAGEVHPALQPLLRQVA